MLNIEYWDQKYYSELVRRDPVIRFLEVIRKRIQKEHVVLDIGAGAGERNLYNFKGNCQQIIGVDLDPRVAVNPLIDTGICCGVERLPLEDNSVDFAFSIYVLEHVENPVAFSKEVARVLKPGGEFWSITPNKWHYVSLIATFTPHKFHQWINEKRGRESDDTFPTHYSLNSKAQFQKHFGKAGMEKIDVIAMESRPNYLGFFLPLFLAGVVYEKLVNSNEIFSGLRVNFFPGYKKKIGIKP